MRLVTVSMRLSEALDGIGRPIAYFPSMAKFLGGVKCAILFCQAFYWSERADEDRQGWFWKSQQELADETGLTIEELRAARKVLAEKGILRSRYDRIHHRLYFKINKPRLDELWVTHNGHVGNSQMADRKTTDGDVGKTDFDRSNSETTEETTRRAEANGRTHPSAGASEPESEPVTPKDLLEAWNEFCAPLGLSAISELSEKRRKAAIARIREHPLAGWWQEVFAQITKSPLLKGHVKPAGSYETPFQATWEWLFKDDNALKVYEGHYRG
jgi:hypothetical protein